MNVFHPAAWAGSAFWQPAGEAMLEFLVSGTAVAVIFMLLRRVIGRLPATFRYATASTSFAALVGLAGYHAWEHWPTTPSPSAAVTNDASPSAPSEPRREPARSVGGGRRAGRLGHPSTCRSLHLGGDETAAHPRVAGAVAHWCATHRLVCRPGLDGSCASASAVDAPHR